MRARCHNCGSKNYDIFGIEVCRYSIQLLKISEELHGYVNGSREETTWTVMDLLCEQLRARLSDWHTEKESDYDRTVKSLCWRVVVEYEAYQQKFRNGVFADSICTVRTR
jgi:hypothetical protein